MNTYLKTLRKAVALCLVFSLLAALPIMASAAESAPPSPGETGQKTDGPVLGSASDGLNAGSNSPSTPAETRPNLDELPDPEQFNATEPPETEPSSAASGDPTHPTIPSDSPRPRPNANRPSYLPADQESDSVSSDSFSSSPSSSAGGSFSNGGYWVPRYYQTDYPDVPYGAGTVATSGCSMTCMAMVVSALTKHDVTPDNLAERFRNADGSHIQRMEAIATIYDIAYTKTFAMYDVVNALKAGKLVVEMVSSPSPFSSTQHLILLTGINEDGKIFVNDPMETNKEKSAALNHGFTYGFDQGFLSYGFSGAWIFEPMEIPQNVQTNYPGIRLTAEEKDILARMVWLEARGESFKGQQAVAEVVLNRLISDQFPGNSLRAIVYAEDQFTTTKFIADTTADELQFKAVEMALNGPNVLPTNVFYFARTPITRNIWGRIGRHVFSYTNN